MNLEKEIENFEAWWKTAQQASWERGRMESDRLEAPPHWGKNFKNYQLEGWLARAAQETR